MIKVDRSLFRAQMKKEFKRFKKDNPNYKSMLFPQFIELVKINMVKLQKQDTATAIKDNDPHHHHDHDDIQDMFAEIEEDDGNSVIK